MNQHTNTIEDMVADDLEKVLAMANFDEPAALDPPPLAPKPVEQPKPVEPVRSVPRPQQQQPVMHSTTEPSKFSFHEDRPAVLRSVSQLVAEVEKAHADQRCKVRDLEGEHELARAKLIDGYRRKAHDLNNEADEALRLLDQRHEKMLSAEKQTLETLERLRG